MKFIKKIVLVIIIIMILMSSVMPNIILAVNEDETEKIVKSYAEWIKDNEEKEDEIERKVKAFLDRDEILPEYNWEDRSAYIVELLTKKPETLRIAANYKSDPFYFEVIGWAITDENGEALEVVEKTYDQLIEYLGLTTEQEIDNLDQKIAERIQQEFFIEEESLPEGYDPYEISKTILELNKETIIIKARGNKSNYEIINFEVPGKDESTLEIEAGKNLGLNVGDNEEDDSDLGGVLLGPIVDLFNTIADIIQSLITAFMRSEVGFRDVLVGKRLSDDYNELGDSVDNKVEVKEVTDTSRHVKWYSGADTFIELWASKDSSYVDSNWSTKISGSAMTTSESDSGDGYVRDSNDYDYSLGENQYFINASGYKNRYGYPLIAYSLEEIFAGDIDLLNANFFNTEEVNSNSGFYVIRNVVMFWFRALRYLGLAGLLSVLIYTGVKIMTSATAQDKAKYKERIVNWVVGIAIMFLLPYIMSFIFTISDKLVDLFNNDSTNNSIEVYVYDANAGNGDWTTNIDNVATDIVADVTGYNGQGHKYTYTKFTTNLMGLVRFQVQSRNVIKMVAYFLMYIMLIIFTIRFTVIYLKRMLYIAFLTMISPIVAMMYPIDKLGDGKSQSFEMWLKEYIFNALLQPLHMLLYYVFVSSAMSFASQNIIYVLVVFGFMTQAEKILKDIFGFGKAGMGTVGGLSGGAATAMTLSALTGTMANVKKMFTPPHTSSNSGNGNPSSNNELESTGDGVNYANFPGIESSQEISEERPEEDSEDDERVDMYNTPGLDIHDYLDNSETGMEIDIPMTDEQRLTQDFSDDENLRLAELMDSGMNSDDAISQIIGEREASNSNSNTNIPSGNANSLLGNDTHTLSASQQGNSITGTQPGGLDVLKMMAQRRTQSLRHSMSKNTPKKVIKGIAKGVVKGVALGGSMFVAGGAVLGQAAISLAMDGKYNPLEGIATFAGATIATNSLLGKAGKSISKGVGNLHSEYKTLRMGDEEYAAKQRRKAFLDNDENFKLYQSKYGDMGYAKLSVEYARGARLAEKGIADLNEQMRVAAYTDSMVDEAFNQKYKGPTKKEDIQRDAKAIRENAKKNGDKNLEKLSDEDIIKVSMRNTVEAGSTTSKEDLAVNTAKARKEIGESVINNSKDKQEAWIEANSAGDKATAEGMRAAIESSQRMNLAVRSEKARQERLQEQYNQHNKRLNDEAKERRELNKRVNEMEKQAKEHFENGSLASDKDVRDWQIALTALDLAQQNGGTLDKEELKQHLQSQYSGSLGTGVDDAVKGAMKTLKEAGCISTSNKATVKVTSTASGATKKLNSFMKEGLKGKAKK